MNKTTIIDFFIRDINFVEKKSSIIINDRVLCEDFLPERILYRDDQLKIILNSLKDFLISKRGINMFFYGNTGTGKTLLARYIANIIKSINISKKMNIKVSYINCKSLISKEADYYVIGKIYSDVTNDKFKKGKKKYEMIENLFEYLANHDLKLIIFLDEFDSLVNGKSNEDILYLLLRDFDIEFPSKISLILISNNITFLNNLDPRTKSSFSSFIKVEFPPYNAEALREILIDRAKLAIKEGAIDRGIINYISAKVVKYFLGDARIAINVLRLSAIIADSKNKSKIEKEDVDEAFNNIDFDILKSVVFSLNSTQRLLLLSLINKQSVKNNDYISFEELYDEYSKLSTSFSISPLGKSTIYKNMKNLEMILGNFIESKTISEGKKGGYKKIYKLLIDEKDIEKIYDLLCKNILNA
ncbi:MAG: AAA family ATPase [Nanopusillaceae archaeon]